MKIVIGSKITDGYDEYEVMLVNDSESLHWAGEYAIKCVKDNSNKGENLGKLYVISADDIQDKIDNKNSLSHYHWYMWDKNQDTYLPCFTLVK